MEDALSQYEQALDQARSEFEPGNAAWTPIKEALGGGALSSADRDFRWSSIKELHARWMEQFSPLPRESLRDRQKLVSAIQDTTRRHVRAGDTYHNPVELDLANPDASKKAIIGLENIAGRLETSAAVSEGSAQCHSQLMVDMTARAMFIPRTEVATSTLPGAPCTRRGWLKILETHSIDLLLGSIPLAGPKTTEQVRWVVAKMRLHSNGNSIALVFIKLRWKANMTTPEAVTQHGDWLGGELLIRCK